MKKLQNNYTTPEQSKRLLELGLPADSADCAYRGLYMPITILSPNVLYSTHEKEIHDLETKRDKQEGFFQTCEPCWSVGRLIEIWFKCIGSLFLDGSDTIKSSLPERIIERFEYEKQNNGTDFSKFELE